LTSGWLTFNEQQLLGLVEVGNMPLMIDTTSKVTRASSITRAAADKTQLDMATMDKCRTNVEG
jgi:hypothetical protein